MYNIKQAKKGDFYTLLGIEYIGDYYIDNDTNIAYTYDPNSKQREVLVPRSIHNTEKIRPRIRLNSGGMDVPVPYKPTPQVLDYKRGYIKRYFVQKRNAPISTITEINEKQLSKLPQDIYNFTVIQWVIGNSSQNIENINRRLVSEKESNFPGITQFFKKFTQFSY